MSEPTRAPETRADDALLADLADDFLRRYRAGERPSVEEYAKQHPELSGRIREVFPAALIMEQSSLGAPRDPAPPAERLGATIGRYKLLERLGEGGFGVVYMAEQQHPVRRKVALKVIKPGFDTHQVIARFEAERQALALMDHANIARVLDAGATDSGRPYFVMELVRGVPITEYCDASQLPPRQRLELFVSVCRAVQHAHTKGIIHRDIKPTNVLVTMHDGVPVPKVIDFGVAKAAGQQLTEKTLFTNFAQMVGTPLYMSPEQAEMSALDVDTRSDVYSLGVLLYELLTGTTPVDKERLKQAAFDEVRRIIREEEPPRPSTRISTLGDKLASVSAHCRTDPKQLGRLVRGELDWIVMRALEKDRTRRYETANGLARDVERYLHDEPIEACPPSATYRLRKLAHRYRAPLAGAAAFVLLLAAASVISTWLAVRATRAERQVVRERDRAVMEKQQKEVALIEKQAALGQATRNERVAQERLAEGLIFAGRSQLKSREAAQARRSFTEAGDLSRSLGISDTSALCGVLMTYAASPPPLLGADASGGAGGFVGQRGWARTIGFDAEGRTVYTGSLDSTVRRWDVRTGEEIDRWNVAGAAPARCFVIDGSRVLVGDAAGILSEWDLTPSGRGAATRPTSVKAHGNNIDGLTISTGRPLSEEIDGIAISPDGRLVLTGGYDLLVKLWDRKTLTHLKTFSGHIEMVHRVAFTPDAKRALSCSENGELRVWDLATGSAVAAFEAHTVSSIIGLAVAPDGKTFATSSVDKMVKVWDMATFQLVHELKGHAGTVASVAYSPDGRLLASASDDATVRIWELASGRELMIFSGDGVWFRHVAFAPDGRSVLCGTVDGRFTMWSLDGSAEIPSFAEHRERVISVASSADGRLALSGSFDRTIKLWDVATGKLLRSCHDPRGNIWGVALSADGRWALAGTEDHAVLMFDLSSGGLAKRFEGHSSTVTAVAFCRDGRRAISASSDTTLKVWDLASGVALHTLKGHTGRVRAVAVSPDGSLAVSGAFDTTLKLWSLETGKHLRDFKGHFHYASAVAFSSDGARLFSGSWDRTLRVWDVATGKELDKLTGHTSWVLSVAISPDGRSAATASYDQTMRLWDLEARREVACFADHAEAVAAVAFSPGGRTVISASRDATIKVRDLDRPGKYRDLTVRIARAREAMKQNPFDPAALATFGEWYAFRGVHDWAIEFFEGARANGGDAHVSSLALARSYWKLGRLDEARREFESALRRNEAPREYLELCLSAVINPPQVLPPTTAPASQPSHPATVPASR